MAVALVTGAARGIGLELSRQLAGRGLTVVLTARDGERAAAAGYGVAKDVALPDDGPTGGFFRDGKPLPW